ncbi:ornithine cyclodeaminase family protein [Wenxinia saemankumensis]|uniref:Ornithine cyclodeaminase n=1 Tax=Wenxinia saemankumensis TaxID=1447782 RepID=A0A1M6FII6_9RHOB|nr:NAD(P)-binding domain-containing protein [Wenxinia saemankumensis]SHI97483.1 ornithine cyclodeaminase [Wenxinia saemankumensis]
MTAFIGFDEGESVLDWIALTDALAAGHELPRAQVEDVFLRRGADTLLNRSAWIDGLGLAVKCATVFPGNKAKGRPVIGGAMTLYSDADGTLEAILDFHLVTKWKTAGDSLLAARRLARPDSREILIVGAGIVGRSLVQAYGAAFPGARFTIWNRSPEGAARFADETGAEVAGDLQAAVGRADIVACATMSTDPVLRGEWLRPGQHVDLIGAYRADMREADDTAIRRARVFCDSRATTIHHIGEFMAPLRSGALTEDAILADHYEPERFRRGSDDEITLFKNGGGAHLDLMTARHILTAWTSR